MQTWWVNFVVREARGIRADVRSGWGRGGHLWYKFWCGGRKRRLGVGGAEGRDKGREWWRGEGVVRLEKRIGVVINRWANMPAWYDIWT